MGRCERFLRYDRETQRGLRKSKRVAAGVRIVQSCDGGCKDTPVALSDRELTTDLPPLVGTLVKTSEGLIDYEAYAAAKLMAERVLAVKAETGAFSAVLLRIGWCQPAKIHRKRSAPPAPRSPA
jgi:hypothetical protein